MTKTSIMFDLSEALEENKDLFNDTTEIENRTKQYRLTELGNAERFADKYSNLVKFVSGWKKWIIYDGRRWAIAPEEEIRKLAHKLVKSLYLDAAISTDQDIAAKIAKWATQSNKSSSITAMLKEASAMLAIDPDKLDSDRWLFNCNNCTINLKTGAVQTHNRDDLITKISPINFDPNATAPIFEETLSVCLGGDSDLVDFVQRFFGYCLSGSNREQCLCIWYGSGQNGKSTILNTISAVFGGYWQATKPETFMVKYNNQNTSDFAKLKGSRLVTASEGEEGQRLAESTIKQMTGGEKLQARFLYGEWFEFTPEFKIILCTNHKPVIRGTDYAIWRRIRLIPFTVTIPKSEQDKKLPEKLKAEAPGILKWVVTGAAQWLTDGLETPAKVEAATEQYKSQQNIIQLFLDYECIERGDMTVGSTDLFKAFDKWRTDQGHRKITQTKFGRMLLEMGYPKSRNSVGRMIYSGIGLISDINCSDCSDKKSNCSEAYIQ